MSDARTTEHGERSTAGAASLWDWCVAFLASLESQGYQAQTVSMRREHLRGFAQWCAERGVVLGAAADRAVFAAYRRHLHTLRDADGSGLALQTQAGRLKTLRAFGRFLIGSGLVAVNPAGAIELPKLPKTLPPAVLHRDQIAAILAAPDVGTPCGVRDRALVELILCGLNPRELVSATLADVAADRQHFTVTAHGGGRGRVVPLSPDAAVWLGRYLDEARPRLAAATGSGSGPHTPERRRRAGLPLVASALFLSRWGAGMWPSNVTWALGPYLEAVGLARSRGLARLREAGAVHLLEAGCDLRYLAALFGFRSLGSVQRYAAVSVQRLKAVHARFHPAEQAAGIEASSAGKAGQNAPPQGV